MRNPPLVNIKTNQQPKNRTRSEDKLCSPPDGGSRTIRLSLQPSGAQNSSPRRWPVVKPEASHSGCPKGYLLLPRPGGL